MRVDPQVLAVVLAVLCYIVRPVPRQEQVYELPQFYECHLECAIIEARHWFGYGKCWNEKVWGLEVCNMINVLMFRQLWDYSSAV